MLCMPGFRIPGKASAARPVGARHAGLSLLQQSGWRPWLLSIQPGQGRHGLSRLPGSTGQRYPPTACLTCSCLSPREGALSAAAVWSGPDRPEADREGSGSPPDPSLSRHDDLPGAGTGRRTAVRNAAWHPRAMAMLSIGHFRLRSSIRSGGELPGVAVGMFTLPSHAGPGACMGDAFPTEASASSWPFPGGSVRKARTTETIPCGWSSITMRLLD